MLYSSSLSSFRPVCFVLDSIIKYIHIKLCMRVWVCTLLGPSGMLHCYFSFLLVLSISSIKLKYSIMRGKIEKTNLPMNSTEQSTATVMGIRGKARLHLVPVWFCIRRVLLGNGFFADRRASTKLVRTFDMYSDHLCVAASRLSWFPILHYVHCIQVVHIAWGFVWEKGFHDVANGSRQTTLHTYYVSRFSHWHNCSPFDSIYFGWKFSIVPLLWS